MSGLDEIIIGAFYIEPPSSKLPWEEEGTSDEKTTRSEWKGEDGVNAKSRSNDDENSKEEVKWNDFSADSNLKTTGLNPIQQGQVNKEDKCIVSQEFSDDVMRKMALGELSLSDIPLGHGQKRRVDPQKVSYENKIIGVGLEETVYRRPAHIRNYSTSEAPFGSFKETHLEKKLLKPWFLESVERGDIHSLPKMPSPISNSNMIVDFGLQEEVPKAPKKIYEAPKAPSNKIIDVGLDNYSPYSDSLISYRGNVPTQIDVNGFGNGSFGISPVAVRPMIASWREEILPTINADKVKSRLPGSQGYSLISKLDIPDKVQDEQNYKYTCNGPSTTSNVLPVSWSLEYESHLKSAQKLSSLLAYSSRMTDGSKRQPFQGNNYGHTMASIQSCPGICINSNMTLSSIYQQPSKCDFSSKIRNELGTAQDTTFDKCNDSNNLTVNKTFVPSFYNSRKADTQISDIVDPNLYRTIQVPTKRNCVTYGILNQREPNIVHPGPRSNNKTPLVKCADVPFGIKLNNERCITNEYVPNIITVTEASGNMQADNVTDDTNKFQPTDPGNLILEHEIHVTSRNTEDNTICSQLSDNESMILTKANVKAKTAKTKWQKIKSFLGRFVCCLRSKNDKN